MDRLLFMMLASVLAGFALLQVPLSGTFLAGIEPITDLIGMLAMLIFSLVLIYNGLMALVRK